MDNKVLIDIDVFNNLIFTIRSLAGIVATKDLTADEMVKLRYIEKLIKDDNEKLSMING